MALFNFEENDIKAATGEGYELLPKGDYTAMVSDYEWKATKGGHMLVLKHEITEGEFAGRVLFDNLNLDNSSEQAVKIALGNLKGLCVAVGMESFFDAVLKVDSVGELESLINAIPEALQNRSFGVAVGIEKSKDEKYGDKNKVWGYRAVEVPVAKTPAKGQRPAFLNKQPTT